MALFAFMPSASVRAANSFSNVAFWGAGAYVWLAIIKPYDEVLAISLVLVGLVSFMFHATGAKLAQAADRIGMYAVLSVLVWAAADHGAETESIRVYFAMVVSWLILTGLNWQLDSHQWVPGLAVVASALIAVFGSWIYALIALGLFIAGVLADKWKPYGHSLRHVFFSLAVVVGFAGI